MSNDFTNFKFTDPWDHLDIPEIEKDIERRNMAIQMQEFFKVITTVQPMAADTLDGIFKFKHRYEDLYN